MSIFTNLENDFEAFWTNHIRPFLHDDVEPLIKTFVQQFDSQFGQQAITAALGAVGSLATGSPFGVVAAGLATTLFEDAKKDAKENATLDAKQILQTIQSALQVAKVANGITTASDQVTVATMTAPATTA